jgi:hypothetical protein
VVVLWPTMIVAHDDHLRELGSKLVGSSIRVKGHCDSPTSVAGDGIVCCVFIIFWTLTLGFVTRTGSATFVEGDSLVFCIHTTKARMNRLLSPYLDLVMAYS